ncbi:DUF4244 domain-containing protein [Kribbella pratensis]|uniref:Uncharacterized protein DUF4244 n=1 Tax=Kribbella pratensis TaxID=2512112 RepID=A0A4R8C4M6_9ACTN|nr:DUF4244 domain-containing protein [Kribbella pratensis]TDW70808.1 uncharacterized protein DUF4244 [Kribbella pratensis]
MSTQVVALSNHFHPTQPGPLDALIPSDLKATHSHTPEPFDSSVSNQLPTHIPAPFDSSVSEQLPTHTPGHLLSQALEHLPHTPEHLPHTSEHRRAHTLRRVRSRTFRHIRTRTERGAATAEYAVTIVAACGLGGILVALLKSPLMQNALKALINYALKIAGVDGVHL